MTPSGTPQGDEAGLEQEGIWEEPQSADASSDPDAGGASRPASVAASRGLTRNITSTARTPGPAGLYYADVPNRIMALIIDVMVLSVSGFVTSSISISTSTNSKASTKFLGNTAGSIRTSVPPG